MTNVNDWGRTLKILISAIAAVLIVIGSAAVLMISNADSYDVLYCLFVVFGLVTIVPMLLEIATGNFDPFNLKNGFLLYLLLQIAVYGVYVLLSGKPFFSEFNPALASNRRLFAQAVFLATAGVAGFYGAYYAVAFLSSRPAPAIASSEVSSIRCWLAGGAFLILGAFTSALLIRSNGGFSEFMQNREVFRNTGISGQGFLFFPATALTSLAALLVWYAELKRTRRRRLLAALLVAASLVPGMLFGFRTVFALPLIQFVAGWHYLKRRLTAASLTILAVAAGIALSVYGAARYSPDRSVKSVSGSDLTRAVILRSQGIEVVSEVILKAGKSVPYDMGWRSVIEAVTIFVPRRIWPGKTTPSTVRFSANFFGDYFWNRDRGYFPETYGGISPTAVGFLLWNFGPLGVVTGMAVFGAIARLVYSAFVARRSPIATFMYTTVLGSFVLIAESPQDALNGMVLRGLSAFALVVLCRRPVSRAVNHAPSGAAPGGPCTTRTAGRHRQSRSFSGKNASPRADSRRQRTDTAGSAALRRVPLC